MRCLHVRANVGVQTFVFVFKIMLFHYRT